MKLYGKSVKVLPYAARNEMRAKGKEYYDIVTVIIHAEDAQPFYYNTI